MIDMFNKRDLAQISDEYFEIIRVAPYYVEFISKNTQHCWIIHKMGFSDKFPFWLYLKHRKENPCYHLQRKKKSINSILNEIKKHDLYHGTGRKTIFDNTKNISRDI